MSPQPEKALRGVGEICAFVETWWREEQGRRGVRVNERTVRRWLKLQRDPLPGKKLTVGGPWISTPSEVRAWLVRHLLISTEMSGNAENAENAG